jgi:hypothetical protein
LDFDELADIRVLTDACQAFLNSLPDSYVAGKPVRSNEPVTRSKPKHGRRKTRH